MKTVTFTMQCDDAEGEVYYKNESLDLTPEIEDVAKLLSTTTYEFESDRLREQMLSLVKQTCGDYRQDDFNWSTWDDLIDHESDEVIEDIVSFANRSPIQKLWALITRYIFNF